MRTPRRRNEERSKSGVGDASIRIFAATAEFAPVLYAGQLGEDPVARRGQLAESESVDLAAPGARSYRVDLPEPEPGESDGADEF
jgi:hypothetical protein